MSLPSNLDLSLVLRDEISKVKSLEPDSYESVMIKRQLSPTNLFFLNLYLKVDVKKQTAKDKSQLIA